MKFYDLTKVLAIIYFLGTLFIVLEVSAVTDNNIKISVNPDRNNCIYKCQEEAKFEITIDVPSLPEKSGRIIVALNPGGNWFKPERKEFKINSLHTALTIPVTMNEPNFLHILVSVFLDDKVNRAEANIAFEPERIRPKENCPKQFQSFWESGRKQCNAIPMDLKLTLLPQYSNNLVKTYKISFANINNSRMHGYISIPCKKPPFPAYITIPGAGFGTPRFPPTGWAKKGAIALAISVHDHDLGLPQEEYKKLANTKFKGYTTEGAPDPQKYYYRQVILGIDKAVSYIASRPDFDRKHMVIDGHSQGGGLALIIAGLNKNISAVAADEPALCDHGAYPERCPGWPRLIYLFDKLHKNEENKIRKMAGFFDVVNFAPNITCPVIMSAGFRDFTCFPSSIYAAYNVIKAPKKIFVNPLAGHSGFPQYRKHKDSWIDNKLFSDKNNPQSVTKNEK